MNDRPIYKTKKFQAAVVGALLAMIAWGLIYSATKDPAKATDFAKWIAMVFGAGVLGQGAADVGKEAAAIKAAAADKSE